MPEGRGGRFLIQWHITDNCEERCRHCYIYDGKKSIRRREELSFSECLGVLDDILETVTGKFGIKVGINFTGGDPLLRRDFFDLVGAAKSRGVLIGILGNPHLITDEIAKELKSAGIVSYQLSIDGSKNTHDQIRSHGSYKRTVSAIQTLVKNGVRVHIMATIGKYNVTDLESIVGLCLQTRVRLFAFDLFVPNNPGEISQILNPQEVRALLFHYQQMAEAVPREKLILAKKNNLFTLLEEDLGIESDLVCQSRTTAVIEAGCSIGISTMSILPDGTVYPCRRLPIAVGKFPEQNMEEIFFQEGNDLDLMRQLTKHEGKMEKCSKCNLFYVCRGCRGMAYAVTGNYFSPDPACWKQ